MSALTEDQVTEICEYLIGTCESVQDAITKHDFEDTDDAIDQVNERIDDIGFCCELCGWWCELSESNDCDICNDCFEGEDE